MNTSCSDLSFCLAKKFDKCSSRFRRTPPKSLWPLNSGLCLLKFLFCLLKSFILPITLIFRSRLSTNCWNGVRVSAVCALFVSRRVELSTCLCVCESLRKKNYWSRHLKRRISILATTYRFAASRTFRPIIMQVWLNLLQSRWWARRARLLLWKGKGLKSLNLKFLGCFGLLCFAKRLCSNNLLLSGR